MHFAPKAMGSHGRAGGEEGQGFPGSSVKALKSNISQNQAQDEVSEQNRMEWKRTNRLTLPGFRRVEMKSSNRYSPTHAGHSSLTESLPHGFVSGPLISHPTKPACKTAPSRPAFQKPARFHLGFLGGSNFSIATQPISLSIGFQLNCILSCSCSWMGPCERVLASGTGWK